VQKRGEEELEMGDDDALSPEDFGFKPDSLGPWSEIKLEIVEDYARAYTTILEKQKRFEFWYVDAFSGAGVHLQKYTGGFVLGSPLNALLVNPPFSRYLFIDLDKRKLDTLRALVPDFPNSERVEFAEGDCNEVLLTRVFQRLEWDKYKRALFLLDPYGLHLDWEVLLKAGQSRAVEVFLNFPLMDMNRNVLKADPEGIDPKQAARMTKFWGDESWRKVAYSDLNLFANEEKDLESERNLTTAFRDRLKSLAGFKYVPEPLRMRHKSGGTLYYLYFATQNEVGNKIVKEIFAKRRGGKSIHGD
jgi:three-Cys-motif partner protein